MKSPISLGLAGAVLIGVTFLALRLITAQGANPKPQEGASVPPSARVLDANFKKALGNLKISLTQAISAAEKHTKGKSFEATVSVAPALASETPPDPVHEVKPAAENNPFFVVYVLANDKVQKVHIDQNGKLISVAEEKTPLFGKQ